MTREREAVRATDVLGQVRAATRSAHVDVERSLDLMNPALTSAQAHAAVARLGAFWAWAEAGLETWAAAFPADAERFGWPSRRRGPLFSAATRTSPGSPEVADAFRGAADAFGTDGGALDTGRAAGRLYVLEGSTLGGRLIRAHLASLPWAAPDHDWSCFDPYGDAVGARWWEFRRELSAWVAEEPGPRTDAVVEGAVDTFAALEAWCRPLGSVA